MRAALLSLAIAFAAPQAQAAVTDYSSFFVFGDSLSDNGNLYAAQGGILNPGAVPLSPPYFEGRFSNGPVWAELVADAFSTTGRFTANFAFGRADALANTDGIPDLLDQVGIFAANVPSFLLGGRPLASVWFGANDLFDALDAGVSDIAAAGRAAADGVAAGIVVLSQTGIGDFLVPSLPDLGQIPSYRLFQPQNAADATTGSDAFNAQLALNIAALRGSGLNIATVNLISLFDDITADPTAFGLTDTTTPCVVPGISVCDPADFDNLAFFDPVHPNRVVHQAIADAAFEALNVAPVPLPASAIVLGTGLMVLGGMRRLVKRRA